MDFHRSIASMCPAGFPEASVSSNTPAGQTGAEAAAAEPAKTAGSSLRITTPPAAGAPAGAQTGKRGGGGGNAAFLTAYLLVLGQRQQGCSGLPHINVHLLLLGVKHVELDELSPQVAVQRGVHAHAVGLGVAELWVAAAVDGSRGAVWELEELEDHVGAGLLRAAGLQVCAALHSDVELVPAAAGQLLQGEKRVSGEASTGRRGEATRLCEPESPGPAQTQAGPQPAPPVCTDGSVQAGEASS